MAGGNLFVEITRDEHILTIGDAKDVFVGQINLKDYVLWKKKIQKLLI